MKNEIRKWKRYVGDGMRWVWELTVEGGCSDGGKIVYWVQYSVERGDWYISNNTGASYGSYRSAAAAKRQVEMEVVKEVVAVDPRVISHVHSKQYQRDAVEAHWKKWSGK